MPLKKIRDCCDVALGAVDGVYGWISETLILLFIVLVFNFAVKWILQRLHNRFEKQNKIWHVSFVSALYKPLSYYVWFFAGIQFLDLIDRYTLAEVTLKNVHLILGLGAILAFAWFLLRWKNNIMNHVTVMSKNHEILFDLSKIDVIDKLLTLLILFVTGLLILEITGSSLNTLIAFGGIGGLAIAFASQEMIANFFGGIMIYITHPFSKGEWVHLPERNIEGHVEEIGWYMTRIRSLDKRPMYVPNSVFSKIVVINPSRMSCRQFKEIIGLRPSDLPRLKAIIEDVKQLLLHHPDINNKAQILVCFCGFGNYSVELQIQAYSLVLDNDGFARVKDDLLFKIAAIFEKHGAETAVPTSIVSLTELHKINT